ncbi:oligosaccharide flippase family protein [Ruegeria sp. HKCCA5426]|uniref:oligosaccharide flippase family protein n=1 Tax=Ruegeria sp. HKCCA5426 TaxID=2682985 RepID=UPI001489E3E5|nr:oligosaccharide flippase family protein [Ruegeria sp. HKCCA5426]
MTWYFVPRMLSAFLSVVILVVMTRVLGPAEFGRYTLTLLLGTLLFSFTFFWLVISVGRFHHAKEFEGKTIGTVLGAAVLIVFALLAIVAMSYVILPFAWANSFFFAAVFCISHAIHEIGAVCLRQYNEGPKFAAVTLLRHALGVSLAVAFIVNGGGYESAVIGISLGAALTGAYAVLVTVGRSRVYFPKRAEAKTYLFFGFPLAVVGSTSVFRAMSTQSLLAVLVGIEAAGYFAAAQALTMRSLVLTMSTLSNVVAPSVFEAHEVKGIAHSDSVLDRYFSFLMLISMPIVVALVSAADVFANLLFDHGFAQETAGYLRVLAIAAFVTGLQGAYFSYSFMRSKKTGLQLVITFGTLIVHALLSLAVINLFGAPGASYAFLVSSLVSFVVYFYIGRKVDPLKVPVRELTKAFAGGLIFVPFGVMAEDATTLLVQAALLLAGSLAMFVTLVLIRQTAAVTVWNRIRPRAR